MAIELIFKDAEEARDAIMASQKEEIAKLYEDWADEIGERAKYYSHKSNASAPLSERYYKELQKQIKQTSHEVSNEVYSKIKKNMYTIADAVVADNIKWLESFGFSAEGLNAAFSYIPDEVVRNLITGQIYDSGWSLSARIWGDNEQTLKDIYQVMARGIAENKPIYEIAKNLESYVRPSAKLPWNPILAMKNTKTGEIEYKRIYKKQVDYNAQRLARTLAQHSYQQSFIATTQKNPFITEYIWHSNGSRPCELCQSRDGVHFAKDELPMDHPNGMCTMEPAVADDMVDQLADWFNSPDGTYPEIDEFAGNFGYEASKVGTVKDFIDKYGTSTKSPNAWFNSLTQVQKAEAKILKEQSGLTWNDWYKQNIYAGDGSNLGGTKKVLAFSKEQEKYLKPYGFSPTNMPTSFDDWSHKVSYEQAGEILQSMGTSWSDPHPYQQLMKWYNDNLTNSNFVTTTAKKTAKTAASKTTTAKVGDNVTDISSWISKIKMQTESQMLAKEREWMQLIGESGKSGIVRYSGSSYGNMNAYLRYLQSGYSESEAISMSGISSSQLKSVKDAIKGLSKVSFDDDYVLRRGTDLGDLAGAFMKGDFETNKMSLYGKTVSELNDMFAGAVGNYGAFTSTSSIWDRGFSGNVEVVLYAPKGTHASSIMSISNFGTGEGETLLNANTTVRCVKIEDSDGHKGSSIRVFMEIITK